MIFHFLVLVLPISWKRTSSLLYEPACFWDLFPLGIYHNLHRSGSYSCFTHSAPQLQKLLVVKPEHPQLHVHEYMYPNYPDLPERSPKNSTINPDLTGPEERFIIAYM